MRDHAVVPTVASPPSPFSQAGLMLRRLTRAAVATALFMLFKGSLAGVSERLGLTGAVFPDQLHGACGEAEIVAAVEEEVAAGRCHPAVLVTLAATIHGRDWTRRVVTAEELAEVQSQLPDDGLPATGHYRPGQIGPIRDLLAGWKDYLELPQGQAEHAKAVHERLLRDLEADQPFSLCPIVRLEGGARVIADGRHRLFALADRAAAAPGVSAAVYWEGQCAS